MASTREKMAAKIGEYYQRLTSGCGLAGCANPNCASSAAFRHAGLAGNNNQLAVLAVELAKADARLCGRDRQPAAASATALKRSVSPPIVLEGDSGSEVAAAAGGPASPMDTSSEGVDGAEAAAASKQHGSASTRLLQSIQMRVEMERQQQLLLRGADHSMAAAPPSAREEPDPFTEATLRRMSGQPDKQPLIRLLSCVFTSPDRTVAAFQQRPPAPLRRPDFDEKHESERSEKEAAPGASSSSVATSPPESAELEEALARLDVHCEHTLTRLIPYEKSVMDPLCGSLNFLCRQVRLELSDRPRPLHLCVVAVLFEFSVLFDPNYYETVVPSICMVAARLPVRYQAALVRFWCRHKTGDDLSMLLLVLMQLLTLRCLLIENEVFGEQSERCLNDDDIVCDVCRVLKLVYYAAGMLGEVDPPAVRAREREETKRLLESLNVYYGQANEEVSERRRRRDGERDHLLCPTDPLAVQLGLRSADCVRPVIPAEEFVNDTLNQLIRVEQDYEFFHNAENGQPGFSFLHYPFLLSTLTKSQALYFDSRIRMFQERRGALIRSLMTQNDHNMYLRIHVRRANIVQDALLTLEMLGLESPGDLKKQLMIEFEGEQGLDEGGLSKEFFQLIVEQIFNPDYGMFCLNQRTQAFWFYPGSEDNDKEFMLVGMLLGLAIYNSVILDVRFPPVLYKKLTGKLGSFADLAGSHPELAQGLQELLAYDDDNLEDTFCSTFCVNYQDAFGNTLGYDLKPNGANVPVTRANRQEFVDLYADFLLNRMIEQQFTAFCKGFHLVNDDSLLLQLFSPSEIELLVCGSKEYNFRDLEACTEYDSGYTRDSQVIVHFWSLVHRMSDAERRLLLEFVTGSDRVPLGGMKKMKFIIARQGPDTDRLPTAHTCFNVLLLPEYSSCDKLKDRLLKAIAFSKGFGML